MRHLVAALLAVAVIGLLPTGCHKDEAQSCTGGKPISDASTCTVVVGEQCFENFSEACACAACPSEAGACFATDDYPAAIVCE